MTSQIALPEKSMKRNMKWTNKQDDMLIHLMRKQCKEGKSIPGGFTAEGWSEMTKQMKTQFGNHFTKDKLKNRFKTIKRWYRRMKIIINLSGFGWDEDKKMITAERGVWDDYLAAHPEATLYRSKRLPDYFLLAEIFGDTVADGREGFATNDPLPLSPPVTPVGVEDELGNIPTQDEAGDGHISTASKRIAPPGGSTPPIMRRQSVEDAMMETVGRMADALDRLASSQNPITRMRMCWEALDPLDIEETLKYRALTFLEGEMKAATFLALPLECRKQWLLAQLESPSAASLLR